MTSQKIQEYHRVWLEKHCLDESWLRAKLREGFHIHHVDGDKQNNASTNLLLIFGRDHLELHGMSLRKLAQRACRSSRPWGLAAYRQAHKDNYWFDMDRAKSKKRIAAIEYAHWMSRIVDEPSQKMTTVVDEPSFI